MAPMLSAKGATQGVADTAPGPQRRSAPRAEVGPSERLSEVHSEGPAVRTSAAVRAETCCGPNCGIARKKTSPNAHIDRIRLEQSGPDSEQYVLFHSDFEVTVFP